MGGNIEAIGFLIETGSIKIGSSSGASRHADYTRCSSRGLTGAHDAVSPVCLGKVKRPIGLFEEGDDGTVPTQWFAGIGYDVRP
jgi:hypothetical protein